MILCVVETKTCVRNKETFKSLGKNKEKKKTQNKFTKKNSKYGAVWCVLVRFGVHFHKVVS